MQACADMPVLLSYALANRWKHALRGYVQSFSRTLVDSGAFSVMQSGARVDVEAYADWAEPWYAEADAVAGLDDIEGDYEKSLRNYEAMPRAFPTYHDSDPPELLEDLVELARERGSWLGIGVVPPRKGKSRFLEETLDRIPHDVHVHGWALYSYSGEKLFRDHPSVSFDSTSWFRSAMDIRNYNRCKHLNYGECLEIVVKMYQRRGRMPCR